MTPKLDFKARRFWVALVVLMSAWILHPFFQPLAWAGMLAVATWPLYRRFAAWMPERLAHRLAPVVFTILMAAFVLAPMVFAFGAVAVEARSLLDQLALADKIGLTAPAWLESLPWVGASAAERWGALLGTPGGMSSWLHDSSMLLGWVRTLGQFVAHHLFVISFSVVFLHFAYRGGDELAGRIDRLLRETLGNGVAPYLELVVRAVRATVVGLLAVALFSGVLTGTLYAVAGFRHAAVWGAVTGLFALVPYLAYGAVGWVALSLAASGAATPALAVCVLGCAAHFVGDKIVRPLLVGNAVQLGFFWVLIASLGGLEAMGLLGVLLGPVMLALGSSLWREWARGDA